MTMDLEAPPTRQGQLEREQRRIGAPEALWQRMIADFAAAVPPSVMAARFHKGLALSLLAVVKRLFSEELGG